MSTPPSVIAAAKRPEGSGAPHPHRTRPRGARPRIRPGFGIALKAGGLAFVAGLAIIAAILGMIIPYQQGVLRRGMESQADKLASSVAEVAATALAAEDYAALVDHCTGVLRRQPGLEYIVVTRADGSALVFRRGGWVFRPAGSTVQPVRDGGFRRGLPPGTEEADAVRSAGAALPEVYHHVLPVERAGISICTVSVGLALDGYRAEQRAAWWHIGALTVMALLVALATALLLSRTVTRTVLRLSGWVRSIGPGNMGQRIRIDTGDELEGLANAFNGMLDLLEARAWWWP